MCGSDETILSCPQDELESASSGNSGEAGGALPDQFETVRGKTVKLVGKQQSCAIALISYSTSKLQGNALLNTVTGDPSALLSEVDSMFEEMFLEDDNGDEINSLIFPIDTIDLSPNLKGIIVDCDLRGYANGFTWLLDSSCEPPPGSINLNNVLNTVKSFVNALDHMSAKGYCWQVIDGHQFFFHSGYGSFRLVYDGTGIIKDPAGAAMPDQIELLHSGVADVIMFLLTGAWPEGRENGLVKHTLSERTSASWDFEANELSGSSEAVCAWGALPVAIRDALFQSCFADPKNSIALEEWTQILQNAIDDIDQCVFCGSDIFNTGIQCPLCGKTTKKDGLLTKWSIHTETQPGEFRMSFGRGTLVPGEFFGFSSGVAPYMKIMYNPKSNLLGVKNISGLTWYVAKPETADDLPPGAITSIEPGMAIEFEGHHRIKMSFLGYES